jgi:hypothetical protein
MQSTTPLDPSLQADDSTSKHPLRHPPGHGLLTNEEVAAQDELQHETALRDSTLRVPR